MIPIYESYFRRNIRNNLWSTSLRHRNWLSKYNISVSDRQNIKCFVIINLIWDNWIIFYHRTCDENGFRPNGSSICHGIKIEMLPGANSTGMLIRLRVGKWICVSKQFENTSKMCNALNDKEMRDYFLYLSILFNFFWNNFMSEW